MNGRIFLDTNVLVYLFDRDSAAKQRKARAILEADGPEGRIVVSTQILQEFYVSVTRKLKKPLPEQEAEAAVRDLAAFHVVEPDVAMVLRAVSKARAHRLSLWDALVVEAADAAGCPRLLTEDLQNGREFGAVRVENPFR